MNLKRYLLAIVTGALLILPTVGCGDKKPTSVVEDASAEAIEAYNRQIAADEAADNADAEEEGE